MQEALLQKLEEARVALEESGAMLENLRGTIAGGQKEPERKQPEWAEPVIRMLVGAIAFNRRTLCNNSSSHGACEL